MLKEDAHQLQKLPFFLQSVEPFVIFSCSSPFLLRRLFQSIRSAALSFTLPVEHSPHCCQRELSKCKSDHVTFCPQFCIAPSSLQHTKCSSLLCTALVSLFLSGLLGSSLITSCTSAPPSCLLFLEHRFCTYCSVYLKLKIPSLPFPSHSLRILRPSWKDQEFEVYCGCGGADLYSQHLRQVDLWDEGQLGLVTESRTARGTL